jgi:hypothetical protein
MPFNGHYRPPPAQAQAQPAQAQAQAQAQPPPPPRRPELALARTGGGLVARVTPPVKRSTLLTTLSAVLCIPVTMVLAKAAPGKVGRLTGPRLLVGAAVDGLGRGAEVAQGR